jgi:ABC-type glycerol-3-phosphate transport system permease component
MRESREDRVLGVVIHVFLGLCLLVVAFPLAYVVSASLSSPQAVTSGRVWILPVDPTLVAYRAIFSNRQIVTGYFNSLVYAAGGTLVNLLFTVLAAYPLSRKQLYGRGLFMGLFVFTMLFSGGLIPTYLVVSWLGIMNTRWAMILPSAMSVWNVVLVRTYFQSNIPEELYQSAELDGCSIYRMLWVIVIPLSGPILAVIALYCAVSSWNSYFDAYIYLSRTRLFPLQIVLRNILIMNQIDPGMVVDVREIARRQGMINLLKYSVIVVASLPLLILYPMVQRHFLRGILIGSLKG